MGNVQAQIGRRARVAGFDIEATKYLGEGGSSFIFLVKDLNGSTSMVLKRLLADTNASFAWIQAEIDMHKRFHHSQIVEFYGSECISKGRDEREVFILMEFCPFGHLYDTMKQMQAKRFTEIQVVKLFQSLCVPVQVLHHEDPPVAHRDLKLENFLLARNKTFKLCDFGSCVIGAQSLLKKEDRLRELEHVAKRTTAMYRSPELADIEGTAMFGAGELTHAVDMWAMGCILYTLAFFKAPFPPEGLRTDRYVIPDTSPYSGNLHTMIARMLTADVEKRADIDHIVACCQAIMEEQPLPPLNASNALPIKVKDFKRDVAVQPVDLMNFEPLGSSSNAFGVSDAPMETFASFADFPSACDKAQSNEKSTGSNAFDPFSDFNGSNALNHRTHN
uniref:non-specific serine/threonine protein kinase n=1 Tax=Albugo laibachii Nc14 TaxID=890382 RepID=F0WK84_9STRA|nr:hypothetical protein DDB_G0280111 [Albugo laibachii Nc14]|eukprot:CCA21687.1 hypothetical protein DDB_G0280111 [Albugo laibachii Nc14]